MNIHKANYVFTKRTLQIYRAKEAKLREQFPGAVLHLAMPVLHFWEYEQGFAWLALLDPENEDVYLDPNNMIEVDGPQESEFQMRVRYIADWFNIDVESTDTHLTESRRVVTAANKYGDTILVGARHCSPAMQTQMNAIKEDRIMDAEISGKAQQGFIDQWDVFMTREEAYKVALDNGQINLMRLKWPSYSKDLFSEDIH